MPSDFLLDTNIVIQLFNRHPLVCKREQRQPLPFLPFVTATELLYGAKRSARRSANVAVYQRFLNRFQILYPDRTTLDVHSDLREALLQIGKPIPENDLWQAALAIQHDAILVTNDHHFDVVPGLRREDWTA